MKTIILLITATGALALASSGLGAVRGVNRLMFDGKYSVPISGFDTTLCSKSVGTGTPHTFRRSGFLAFTIRNGTVQGGKSLHAAGLVAGTPIRFFGLSRITGSIDAAVSIYRVKLNFVPGIANPKQISVQYTLNGNGPSAPGCTEKSHYAGIGHRVGP
jgi:hypothetical protein